VISSLFAALLAIAAPTTEEVSPSWSAAELKQLLARQMAARNDDDSVSNAGAAYRLSRTSGESVDAFAKRIVLKRRADHPNVKDGGWLLAAFGLFYRDVADRASIIARFERDRNERHYFEQRAKEAAALAEEAAKEVQLSLEGMSGYMAPLPTVEECDELDKYGVDITVRNGVVSIENMDRAKFVNDAPAPEAQRTSRGALRELYAAQMNYNKSQAMLGMYEAQNARNKGNARLTLPAASPAIYLNEIVLGGLEADMHTIRLMVLKKGSSLCELRVPLTVSKKPPKKPKKGAPPVRTEATEVRCPNSVTVQKCVDRIVLEKKSGPVIFKVN
jgi:hypothetical protein